MAHSTLHPQVVVSHNEIVNPITPNQLSRMVRMSILRTVWATSRSATAVSLVFRSARVIVFSQVVFNTKGGSRKLADLRRRPSLALHTPG